MSEEYLKATDNICKLMELTEQPLTNDQRSTLVGALSIWMNHKPDNSELIAEIEKRQTYLRVHHKYRSDEYIFLTKILEALGDKDE